jgi:hypothetical protein
MSQYFVKANLRHNGRRYNVGDTIELSEAQARPLAHAIQDEPVSAPEAPAEVQTPTTPVAEVSVGGERSDTGEPSIDGTSDAIRSEAEDVTPIVSAPEAPAEETKPEATAKRGQSSRGKQTKTEETAPVTDATPAVDPSANL